MKRVDICGLRLMVLIVILMSIVACSNEKSSDKANGKETQGAVARRAPEYFFSKNFQIKESPLGLSLNHNKKPFFWSIFAGRSYYSIIEADGSDGVEVLLNGNSVGQFSGFLAYVRGVNGAPDNGWIGHTPKKDGTMLYQTGTWGRKSSGNWVLKDWFVSDKSGQHISYGILKQGMWHNCVDGIMNQGFDRVSPASFSTGGNHYAYMAKNGESWFVVIDGVKQEASFANIKEIQFAEKSGSVAYIGTRDQKDFVVQNGLSNKGYVECDGLVLSEDGTTSAYRCRESNGWYVIVGTGNEIKASSEMFEKVSRPALSKNGTHFVYYATKDGSNYVVVDGKLTMDFNGSYGIPPIVTNDGKVTIAYDDPGKKARVVVWGVDTGLWEGISLPILNPKTDSVAFIGKQGDNKSVVVDGNTVASYSDVKGLTFTPDSGLLAYAAKQDNGRWKVCVGNLCGQEFDNVTASLYISPSEEVLAYGILNSDNSYQVSANGMLSDRYTSIGLPAFSDGKLSCYGFSQDGCYLVEYTTMD